MALKSYPVDASGNLLRDVSPYYTYNWTTRRSERISVEYTEQPNDPFMAKLDYKGYWRGTSAICFQWEDQTGHKYPMFMTDMNRLVESGAIIEGTVWGMWRAVKRSRYYGIQLVPEDA